MCFRWLIINVVNLTVTFSADTTFFTVDIGLPHNLTDTAVSITINRSVIHSFEHIVSCLGPPQVSGSSGAIVVQYTVLILTSSHHLLAKSQTLTIRFRFIQITGNKVICPEQVLDPCGVNSVFIRTIVSCRLCCSDCIIVSLHCRLKIQPFILTHQPVEQCNGFRTNSRSIQFIESNNAQSVELSSDQFLKLLQQLISQSVHRTSPHLRHCCRNHLHRHPPAPT